MTANDSLPASFREQVLDSTISIGYGVDVGDVDGDGKPDVLLADKKQIVWYRNGDWKKFVMAENLTTFDNVCIAARDVDGDGKVEVAVGAQWNPGETSNDSLSGSVHFLVRPKDATKRWQSIRLPHEPTVHRMRWARNSAGNFFLVVLPLHGRGNQNGEGAGVNVFAFEFPKNVRGKWPKHKIADDMHLTHNFDVLEESGQPARLIIAGKEGAKLYPLPLEDAPARDTWQLPRQIDASGEVRRAHGLLAFIQPMHGNKVVVYDTQGVATVLDSSYHEGHALGIGDFDGSGRGQVVAGWRNPDKNGEVGVRLFTYNIQRRQWEAAWLDRNSMACEDLRIADLNSDGKPDIIASGRATGNVKIYWSN